MWGQAWIADYPDGDNFMQLLYGPNTGQSNNGCYESKAFDALYEKVAATMPDSPERNHLFLDMTRQMEVDGAWRLGVSRMRNNLVRPWVKGSRSTPSCTRSGNISISRHDSHEPHPAPSAPADPDRRAGSPGNFL